MPRAARALPAWLAHPLRWQRLPVPWAAVARGALCAGPLLGAGLATGHTAAGVLAGLGSMLAGVNDRPGTRRTGIVHIGLPALASALGMLIGAALHASGAGWWIVAALFAVGFVSGAGSVAGPVRSTAGMQMLATTILGAGRDYGLRVALCIAASAAVALLLRADHWYWLPVTATFLVKPDLGPLFSRTVNRFTGTVAGVLVFAAAGQLLTWTGAGAWWPAVVAGAGGALLPFATRHFALQTVAITLMVLSFVTVGGDPQAAAERIVDTSLACGIVLVVGHLPHLADPRRRVGQRVAAALRATEDFLRHVLESAPGADPTARLALRRAAYRALAQARTTAETAAAELRTARDRTPDWLTGVTAAERIVDAATACAVRLDHGARRPAPDEAERLCQALATMADAFEAPRHRATGTSAPAVDLRADPDCATLTDVASELERLRGYAGAG